jgi:hypothetical protein
MIQGMVQTRMRRLTDLLNDPDAVHLVLEDAKFVELGSRRIVGNAAAAQLQMQDVLMVYTTGDTEGSPALQMSKQQIRATLLMPPFTVDGIIYLAYESELRVALNGLTDKWLPVSTARYWAYGVAEEPVSTPLLVVNRLRAQIVVPKGVDWKTTDESGSRQRQNPW